MQSGHALPCPTNYSNPSPYFTGFDDTPRSCSCACDLTTPGTCSGTPQVRMYQGTSSCCCGTTTLMNTCDNSNVSLYHRATLGSVSPNSSGACTAGTTESGSATMLGEQTVCCTP
jgi:hypothetical protein